MLGGFAAFGAFWGAWGATLPAIQSHAGVDDGQLGIALLCVGAGALVSMRAAGTLVDRWGAPALPATLAAFGCAAALPALATSTAGLCAALLVLGATSGAVDVAINAEGVSTEAATGRPVLSLAHGTFSACVVGGSLAAGGLRAAGAGPEAVLVLVGLVVVATAAALLRAPAARAPASAGAPSLRPVPRLLLVLGGLCALAFFVENAWQSWGAVHLESDLDASPALGALAPALFAGAAALSRLGGHALAGRVSELTLLRGGRPWAPPARCSARSPRRAGLALVGHRGRRRRHLDLRARALLDRRSRCRRGPARRRGVDRDHDRLPGFPRRPRRGGPARERHGARDEPRRGGRRRRAAGHPGALEHSYRGVRIEAQAAARPLRRRAVRPTGSRHDPLGVVGCRCERIRD